MYEEKKTNSVFAARPLLEANGDENNEASAPEMLAGMEKDFDILQKQELRPCLDHRHG